LVCCPDTGRSLTRRTGRSSTRDPTLHSPDTAPPLSASQ
jgi:hypothetical protein